MPQPRYADLGRFCEIDGWEDVVGAAGRTGDHGRYRKILPDGTVLRTKVSHGSGRIEDPGLWRRIWRDQLGLETEDTFWETLRTRRPAERGTDPPEPPSGPSIPAWVAAGLIDAEVAESEIRALSSEEAQRRLAAAWSQPRHDT